MLMKYDDVCGLKITYLTYNQAGPPMLKMMHIIKRGIDFPHTHMTWFNANWKVFVYFICEASMQWLDSDSAISPWTECAKGMDIGFDSFISSTCPATCLSWRQTWVGDLFQYGHERVTTTHIKTVILFLSWQSFRHMSQGGCVHSNLTDSRGLATVICQWAAQQFLFTERNPSQQP